MTPFEIFKKSGEKGSITVLIVFLLPVMLLMLALVVNINQLIFTKIKLQNTVDACALSAAVVQAAGLNEIADLNKQMVLENQKISNFLRRGTWYSKRQAENAKNFFYNRRTGVIDCIRKYQNKSNKDFAEKADDVAQHVKQLNLPDSALNRINRRNTLTDLKENGNFTNIRYRYYQYHDPDPDRSPVSTVKWHKPDRKPQYCLRHNGRYISLAKRRGRRTGNFSILERVRKEGSTPTYAHYELTFQGDQFFMANPVFGRFPELKATAAARPAGGNIKYLNPKYAAVLIR